MRLAFALALMPRLAVDAEPFYVWIEAGSLGDCAQVKSDKASNGTFVAGGSASASCRASSAQVAG